MRPSDISLDLISLDGPKPLEVGQTNRFAYMKHGAYNLVLDLTFTFASEIVDSQYGKYCWVTPEAEDLPKLLEIESFLENSNHSAKIGFEELPYAMKKMFGDNYNYRLKIRGALEAISVENGAKINITCTPGFYFNETESTYGCFFSSVKMGKPVKKVVKRK